ncbi:uncharacterized protein LOC114784889 isoform X1 [Denticeps clupeoides]|uniref:uncharacterized protein LOC114784889 isoform X1 n=2 Tax=Denticeps clupeoides TaxID=299321 RepID=UPI0010A32828|nr:uncharacterized protein LOC114784889 isoform X1 [Denticeps clupeoides]
MTIWLTFLCISIIVRRPCQINEGLKICVMSMARADEVKRGIGVIWENLQCPICLDLMRVPVSTKCDHQFCKFCMMKLLDGSKKKEASCPVCKLKVTKRGLQESPGFQRLIEGLQRLIQAYEYDTCTNFCTGKSKKRQPASDEDAEREQSHDSETSSPKGTNQNAVSVSSARTATNAFAQLMGLEDAHNGFDSGLGDPVPEKETDRSSEACVKQVNGHQRALVDANRIADSKQKKTVEKVSEWLLKFSSTEDSLTDGKCSDRRTANGSVSDAGSDTEIPANWTTEAGTSREVGRKCLEDQVFGAVYKRDRRSAGAQLNRSFSPVRLKVAEPAGNATMEQEIPVQKKMTRKRKAGTMTPAAFIKRPRTQDSNENVALDLHDPVQPTNPHKPEEAGTNREDSHGKEDVKEPGNFEEAPVAGILEDSPVFDVAINRGPRSRAKMQQADNELGTTRTEVEQNKKLSRTCRSKGKPRGRTCKVTKALPMVPVGKKTSNLVEKPMALEPEVEIESFPSSSPPVAHMARKTRRSQRLQRTSTVVQGGRRTRSARSLVVTTDEDLSGNKDKGTRSDNRNVEMVVSEQDKVLVTNGCVCDDDMGGIEHMDTSSSKESSLVAVVPRAHHPPKNPERPDSVVEAENCPLEAVVPSSPNEGPQQESPCAAAVASAARPGHGDSEGTSASRSRCIEEDENDSELDTEQLLRTFKVTKRKSFCLGSPDKLLSRDFTRTTGRFQKMANVGGDFGNSYPHESKEAASRDGDLVPQPPSQVANTTSQKSADSAPLTPNMVSRSRGPSPPRTADSQFPALGSSEDLHNRGSGSSKYDVADANNRGPFSESSVTPDGLLPLESAGQAAGTLSQPIERKVKRTAQRLDSSDSESGSEENLPPLSQFFHPGRAPSPVRKSQSILACLNRATGAQEPQPHPEVVPSSLDAREQTVNFPGGGDGHVSPSQCREEWLGPSQASVDLFGTPEECADECLDEPGAADTGESSQYSSEIINTQQKAEMQEELRRLERMMALVSRALQQKEAEPERPRQALSNHVTGGVSGKASASTAIDGQGPSRQSGPNWARECGSVAPSRGAPDDLGPTQPCATQVEEGKETGQRSRRGRQSQSCGKPPSQRSGLRSEVKGRTEVVLGGPAEPQRDKMTPCETKAADTGTLELVASGLSGSELLKVKRFAKKLGGSVNSLVTPRTTHVIMKTDDDLACERTLKYFQGIASRKWVVSFLWVSESFRQGKVLDEADFEVRGDVVSGREHGGPRKARSSGDQRLLMSSHEICFHGAFTDDMTTGQMAWMVEQCGGTVVKDLLHFSSKQMSLRLVVVQLQQPPPDFSAFQVEAAVVSRSWLLDSIATYSLQNPEDYRP